MIYKIHYPDDAGKKFEMITYPAGETQIRLLDSELEAVAEAKQIQVTARITHGEIMPLALLTDALRAANGGNAENTVLTLPYLPYSRADRRFTLGDCAGLQTFGAMINELGYSLVVTLDAHSAAAKRYIANLYNVKPELLIHRAMTYINKDLAVILPDEGARRYSLPNTVQCRKKRDPKTGALFGFQVPPIPGEGKRSALIVDDICDGGGTFLGIAQEIVGDVDLYLYVTHGIFSKGFKDLHANFKGIYTSDSLLSISDGATVLPADEIIDSAIYGLLGGDFYDRMPE